MLHKLLRASIILVLGVLQTPWWFSNICSVDCVVKLIGHSSKGSDDVEK